MTNSSSHKTHGDQPHGSKNHGHRILDKEISHWVNKEEQRQREGLELIASENYVSDSVLAAQGSVLTNKYAEGYPGKRYYGGCEFVDEVESLALARVKRLFGAEAANVQPHSGSQANMAVYLSFMKPGDKMLGMNLSHGGHLTHGSSVNFSGKLFQTAFYGVQAETGLIDYDQLRDIAIKEKPQALVAGASAYPRIIDFHKFKSIAKEVGAKLVVDMAHIAGLVAAGFHPSPVGHADFVTSTTHKTLRGPRGGLILCGNENLKSINSLIFPGIQGGPLMHVIAAKAVSFGEALQPEFKIYCQQILLNSRALADVLLEHDYRLVSGGTDNHLVLVDLRNKGLTGKEAEEALGKAGITVNKNAVPFDTQSPFITSGIRIGVPAITTRGFKEAQTKQVANWIHQALSHHKEDGYLNKLRQDVREFSTEYPLFNGRSS